MIDHDEAEAIVDYDAPAWWRCVIDVPDLLLDFQHVEFDGPDVIAVYTTKFTDPPVHRTRISRADRRPDGSGWCRAVTRETRWIKSL